MRRMERSCSYQFWIGLTSVPLAPATRSVTTVTSDGQQRTGDDSTVLDWSGVVISEALPGSGLSLSGTQQVSRGRTLPLAAGLLLGGGDETLTVSWNFIPAGSLDLAVTNVKVAQVVFDPDINGDNQIDLVMGRETVALATISATGADPTDTRTVTIEAKFCNQVVDTGTRVLGQISPNGEKVQLYFTPSTRGGCFLVVTIDPNNQIAESDKANNIRLVTVDVKPTRPFHVGYFAINDCSPGGC